MNCKDSLLFPVRVTLNLIVNGATIRSERGGYSLTRIPGGTFMMGSPTTEDAHQDDEGPQHLVSLNDFYLGTHPVTNDEYQRFVEANPSIRRPVYWTIEAFNAPKQPVVGISLKEAEAYCKWANLVLPTEAQWEYACRAGSHTPYWNGTNEADLDKVAWFRENSNGHTHLVGAKPPNPFGLHDMHGNVWEWCRDWYSNYKVPPRPGDGSRHRQKSRFRVVRGGSWRGSAECGRSAARRGYEEKFRYFILGFRPARLVS